MNPLLQVTNRTWRFEMFTFNALPPEFSFSARKVEELLRLDGTPAALFERNPTPFHEALFDSGLERQKSRREPLDLFVLVRADRKDEESWDWRLWACGQSLRKPLQFSGRDAPHERAVQCLAFGVVTALLHWPHPNPTLSPVTFKE